MFFGRQDGGQDEKLVGRLVILFIFGRQDGGQDPAYRMVDTCISIRWAGVGRSGQE